MRSERQLNNMAGNSLEHQLRMGKITHLMEWTLLKGDDGLGEFGCAFCDLKVNAPNLRVARRKAEEYGKCRKN